MSVRRVRRLIALLLVATLLVGGAAVAQTATPDAESPFQIVRVESFEYSLDPFFVCVVVLTSRHERLSQDQGVVTTLTFQPFVRSGDQMIALDPFTTFESAITEDAFVGQSFVCAPQVAVEDEVDG